MFHKYNNRMEINNLMSSGLDDVKGTSEEQDTGF